MRLSSAALALMLTTTSARAGAGTGLTDAEQPFCRTRDGLVQYVTAIVRGAEPRSAGVPGCVSIREGLKLDVIEVEADTPIGSIARVRVFRGDGVSVEGFTFGPEPEAP